jgi:Tfp pilus assembly protein PilV
MLAIFKKIKGTQAGDTMIEVLIAIAVASFAIGTSYAIANRSILKAVTASERNQAVNITESEISALKNRYIYTERNKFNSQFAVPSGFVAASYPATAQHFCLDATATNPGDDSTWLPKVNNISSQTDMNSTGWDDACKINTSSTTYFVDIAATVTTTSSSSSNRTIYEVSVVWSEAGTGHTNQSIVYYRF